jgi:hypothetical protein
MPGQTSNRIADPLERLSTPQLRAIARALRVRAGTDRVPQAALVRELTKIEHLILSRQSH